MAVKLTKGQICWHYTKNSMSLGVLFVWKVSYLYQKVHTKPLFWPYAALIHHVKSEINSLLSLMWCCGCSTVWTSKIIQRTNAFPVGITVDVWCIVPRSDSNSCLVQDRWHFSCSCLWIRWFYFSVTYCKRSSLSVGRCSSYPDVSIIIPRNSITFWVSLVQDWH